MTSCIFQQYPVDVRALHIAAAGAFVGEIVGTFVGSVVGAGEVSVLQPNPKIDRTKQNIERKKPSGWTIDDSAISSVLFGPHSICAETLQNINVT